METPLSPTGARSTNVRQIRSLLSFREFPLASLTNKASSHTLVRLEEFHVLECAPSSPLSHHSNADDRGVHDAIYAGCLAAGRDVGGLAACSGGNGRRVSDGAVLG